MNTKNLHMPFVMATVSGKGGVGKSIASVNIAVTLSQMGYRVAVVDADPGLANCASMFNEHVHASVTDWVAGRCDLEDLFTDAQGVTLVTAANEPGPLSGKYDLLINALDQILQHLAWNHDFIILDTPAGLGEMNLWALDRSGLGAVMLVDEPTAVSDIYRFCKYVLNIDPTYPFASIVNMAEDEEDAAKVHERFNSIVKYFLKTEIPSMGFIPGSQDIRRSVKLQQPVMRLDPDERIAREFNFIAHNIVALARDIQNRTGGIHHQEPIRGQS
jgi:flagellar biosynthesis protein FlhG